MFALSPVADLGILMCSSLLMPANTPEGPMCSDWPDIDVMSLFLGDFPANELMLRIPDADYLLSRLVFPILMPFWSWWSWLLAEVIGPPDFLPVLVVLSVYGLFGCWYSSTSRIYYYWLYSYYIASISLLAPGIMKPPKAICCGALAIAD
jgi:hypothetical protein